MKRTVIIIIMMLVIAVTALSDPVEQQDRRRRDREDKKAVLWPPPKDEKFVTKDQSAAIKSKKTKKPVQTTIAIPPTKPRNLTPASPDSTVVHDFLEPPTWIQSQTTTSATGASIDYLNPPNWNAQHMASQLPKAVYAAPKASDLSVNSMFGSALPDNLSNKSVITNPPSLFSHDDYLTMPSYDLNLSNWRSSFTAGDSAYSRVQRQLQGYQSAGSDIDRIYQRWLPQRK